MTKLSDFIKILLAISLLFTVYCEGGFARKHRETTKVIAFHKPPGVVTSNVSQDDRPTVFDFFSEDTLRAAGIKSTLHAVGRLDADTSGLLLLTNDSLLVHAATNPNAKVHFDDPAGSQFNFEKLEKQYTALVMGNLTDMSLQTLREGVDLGAKIGMTAPAKVEIIERFRSTTEASITITEGKNRQIRRMFHAVKSGVMKLHRNRIGGISIGKLREGDFMVLSNSEINSKLGWPIRSLKK